MGALVCGQAEQWLFCKLARTGLIGGLVPFDLGVMGALLFRVTRGGAAPPPRRPGYTGHMTLEGNVQVCGDEGKKMKQFWRMQSV